jgi:hypothetical protein
MMIEVKFEPRDIIKLELTMKQLDAKVLLQGEWMPFMGKVVEIVSRYPADFPGNTYTRTHNLEANWHWKVLDALTGQIENLAIYAGWVQGHEQTAGHAGHGWTNAFEKAKDLVYILIERVGDKAEEIWAQK